MSASSRRTFIKTLGATAVLAGVDSKKLAAAAAAVSKASRAVVPDLPFSFSLVGDFGSGNVQYEGMPGSTPNPDAHAVAKSIERTTPPSGSRYLISLGDTCYIPYPYRGASETIEADSVAVYDEAIGQLFHRYIKFPSGSRSAFAGRGSAVQRFYTVIGDHDWWHQPRVDVHDALHFPPDRSEYPARRIPAQQKFVIESPGNPFLEYFGNQGRASSSRNIRYYDFRKGGIHWIVLSSDPNEVLLGTLANAYTFQDGFPHGTPGEQNVQTSRQGRWFRRVAAASTARWRFALAHNPPFSSSRPGSPYHGHFSASYMQWGFGKYGVDAVFSGHVHAYERLYVDGVTYVAVGGGGTFEPLAQFLPDPAPGSLVRVPERFGHLGAVEKRGALFFSYLAVRTPNTSGATAVKDRFVFLNRGALTDAEEIRKQNTIHVMGGGGVLRLRENLRLGNQLAGTATLRKSGRFRLSLGSPNPHFAGRLELHQGTVRLEGDQYLSRNASIILRGGTLEIMASVQDFATPLELARTSVLVLGSGAKLRFGGSRRSPWRRGSLLIIQGDPGSRALRFGNASRGLTLRQLAAIRFGSPDGPGARITSEGHIVPDE